MLPIYTVLEPNGNSIEVCSIGGPTSIGGPFGTYNKLSNRRYLRFTIASAGRYRLNVDGPVGSDPDVVLYQRDFITIAQTNSNDVIERDFTAGDYVIEVYEAGNVFADREQSAAGRTCIDVTLQPV